MEEKQVPLRLLLYSCSSSCAPKCPARLAFCSKFCVSALNLETKAILRDNDHCLMGSPSQAVPSGLKLRSSSSWPSCLQDPPRPHGSLSLPPHLSKEFGDWVYVITKYNFLPLLLDLRLLSLTKDYLLPEY